MIGRMTYYAALCLIFTFNAAAQTGPAALLPAEGETEGWVLNGDPALYGGDDLFFLINGGADIYYEYGFREVIAASFTNPGGEEIKLEVYRMKDCFAAYAVFLQQSTGSEKGKSFGTNSFVNNGSLGFWKHHYFILMRSNSENSIVSDGMSMMAGSVDKRIKQECRLPDIATSFSNRSGRITLLRGKIALSNIYYFSPRDIFLIEEGIAVEESGVKEIWLHYSDPGKPVQRLAEVSALLSSDNRFTGFAMSGAETVTFSDNRGNRITMEASGNLLKIRVVPQ
jgi:hypothetical protein